MKREREDENILDKQKTIKIFYEKVEKFNEEIKIFNEEVKTWENESEDKINVKNNLLLPLEKEKEYTINMLSLILNIQTQDYIRIDLSIELEDARGYDDYLNNTIKILDDYISIDDNPFLETEKKIKFTGSIIINPFSSSFSENITLNRVLLSSEKKEEDISIHYLHSLEIDNINLTIHYKDKIINSNQICEKDVTFTECFSEGYIPLFGDIFENESANKFFDKKYTHICPELMLKIHNDNNNLYKTKIKDKIFGNIRFYLEEIKFCSIHQRWLEIDKDSDSFPGIECHKWIEEFIKYYNIKSSLE